MVQYPYFNTTTVNGVHFKRDTSVPMAGGVTN